MAKHIVMFKLFLTILYHYRKGVYAQATVVLPASVPYKRKRVTRIVANADQL